MENNERSFLRFCIGLYTFLSVVSLILGAGLLIIAISEERDTMLPIMLTVAGLLNIILTCGISAALEDAHRVKLELQELKRKIDSAGIIEE